MAMNECERADFTMGDFDNKGRDPVDQLLGRMGHLKIRAGTCQAVGKPKKDVDAAYDISTARNRENMCLLLQDYVLKSRHVARETRFDLWGPKRPTRIEPAALKLMETMDTWRIDWRRVAYRKNYLEELDFVWRTETNLPGVTGYKAIWVYVSGLARTWDNRQWWQRPDSGGKNYHLLKLLQVPTLPQMIRNNKFIGYGDDSKACICPDGMEECVRRCVYL